MLLGLLAITLAENTKKAKKEAEPSTSGTATDEKKSEDKPKRGLELSLGDHYGFGGYGGGYGGDFGHFGGLSAAGPHHEHITHDHVKTVTITKHVPVLQPYPVVHEKHVPVPYHVAVKVPVDRPYPVHVPQPYPVIHEKHIPVPVERPVPYAVKYPVKVCTLCLFIILKFFYNLFIHDDNRSKLNLSSIKNI